MMYSEKGRGCVVLQRRGVVNKSPMQTTSNVPTHLIPWETAMCATLRNTAVQSHMSRDYWSTGKVLQLTKTTAVSVVTCFVEVGGLVL